jgi:hypothetical protein
MGIAGQLDARPLPFRRRLTAFWSTRPHGDALAHNPEIKWRLRPGVIDELWNSEAIPRKASRLRQAELVYSCSLNRKTKLSGLTSGGAPNTGRDAGTALQRMG